MKKTTVRLISLGCSKNLVDSEKILGHLPLSRYRLVDEGEERADLAIVNTCGFIHDAREESIDTILELLEARKRGMVGEVLVTGCLSQRYREELQAEIPEVKAWFGARDNGELLRHLQLPYDPLDPRRHLSTPSHYAYLKISEGCDRTCSFCAIPQIRGGHISQPMDALVKEARLLAGRGVRELLLVAQDLSYYGLDQGGRSLLADLLRALAAIEGIRWLRMHYAYPNRFPEEVIGLMAREEKICKYLDIPIQHINDKLLRSMRRGHTRAATIDLLERLRSEVPGIALRTSLIVGYPGETDAAFDELFQFVRDFRFERLGVFSYSSEEGTNAYSLGDPVPAGVKEERLEAIMELQAGISLEKNQARVGQEMEVVVDRREGDLFVGRTRFDSPEVDNEVLIQPHEGLQPGSFVRVLITGATEFDLHGELSPDHLSKLQ